MEVNFHSPLEPRRGRGISLEMKFHILISAGNEQELCSLVWAHANIFAVCRKGY